MTKYQQKNIENLTTHIAALQATLAKRDLAIESLRDTLAEKNIKLAELADPSLINNQIITRAYKDGWNDCAEELMSETATMANSLLCLRSKAFESLLKNEKR